MLGSGVLKSFSVKKESHSASRRFGCLILVHFECQIPHVIGGQFFGLLVFNIPVPVVVLGLVGSKRE